MIDCYQIIADLLRRDDLEDPQNFDANKGLTIWSYGTCSVVLKQRKQTSNVPFDTFPLLDVARAAAIISTKCLPLPAISNAGTYTLPVGPRAIFDVEIDNNNKPVSKPTNSTTQLATTAITCFTHQTHFHAHPVSENDCNAGMAEILARMDSMSTQTFYSEDDATESVMTDNSTVQAHGLRYVRVKTPCGFHVGNCNIVISQVEKREDNFRLVDAARFAAMILHSCRPLGPPFLGGTKPIGRKRAFETSVFGDAIGPPPLM